MNIFPDRPLLGTLVKGEKEYKWKTYSQVATLAQRIGTVILSKKLYYNTQTEGLNYNINLFGVYAKNREEWLLLEYAAYYYNFTLVPLYGNILDLI